MPKQVVYAMSLTYHAQGHSREYLDQFVSRLGEDFDIKVITFGGGKCTSPTLQSSVVGDPGRLNYAGAGLRAAWLKVARRFVASTRVILLLRKELRNRARVGNTESAPIVYFMDYEYLALCCLAAMFPRNIRRVVWIHSASITGRGLAYKIYKRLFFRAMRAYKGIEYVVNGVAAERELRLVLPHAKVHAIQYPSELGVVPKCKSEAKSALGVSGKYVFSIIGMIRPDKGYGQTLSALGQAGCFSTGEALLIIAGQPAGIDISELDAWQAQAQIVGVKRDLRYLPEELMNLYFSATDALIIPCGQTGTSQSGPASLARSYDLGVIAPACGEIGEYVARERLGLTYGNEGELAKCADHACFIGFHPGLRSSRESARRKYSWDSAAEAYRKLFSQQAAGLGSQ